MIQVLLGKLYKSRMKFCRVKLLRCVCVHTYARERKRPIEQLHTYTTVQNSRRTLNVPKTKPSPSGLQLTVIFTIDWSFCLFGPWNVKKLKRWTYNSKLTRQTVKSLTSDRIQDIYEVDVLATVGGFIFVIFAGINQVKQMKVFRISLSWIQTDSFFHSSCFKVQVQKLYWTSDDMSVYFDRRAADQWQRRVTVEAEPQSPAEAGCRLTGWWQKFSVLMWPLLSCSHPVNNRQCSDRGWDSWLRTSLCVNEINPQRLWQTAVPAGNFWFAGRATPLALFWPGRRAG